MADIEIIDLKKTYTGGKAAFENFNLTINGGEFVVLLGPTGAGKTAVLRTLCGLDDVTDGDIKLMGESIKTCQPKDRDMAVLFRSIGLYPYLNVYDNLAFGLKMRKMPRAAIEERVYFVSKLLGIGGILGKKPKALSALERARVSIGRAVIRQSKLILMDDPFSGFDANLKSQLINDVLKVQQRLKVNVILSTKDAAEALTLADRIVYMEDGKIIQVGTPEEVYTSPATVAEALYIGSPKINLIEGKIESNDGKNEFVFAGGRLLTDKPACERCYLAVRPENVTIGGEFAATATLKEQLAEDRYLLEISFADGGKPYLMLSETLTEGEVKVSLNSSLFFDAATELRL